MKMKETFVVKIDPCEENCLILVDLNNEVDIKKKFGLCCERLIYDKVGKYTVITENIKYPETALWFKFCSKRLANKTIIFIDKNIDVTKKQFVKISRKVNFKVKSPRIVVIHDDETTDNEDN